MKVPKLRTGSGARSYGSHVHGRPTSMAAAFAWIIGIMRSTLGFDLFLFISNPPADDSGKAGLRYWLDS
ncbi:hypothetical protein [Bradyrhizobium tunisiense]|uniref:hypothetical protein n=1 Tax=Bradyrhizobium tunisiense TaxID=3278709 RepID=UPI0035D69F13